MDTIKSKLDAAGPIIFTAIMGAATGASIKMLNSKISGTLALWAIGGAIILPAILYAGAKITEKK